MRRRAASGRQLLEPVGGEVEPPDLPVDAQRPVAQAPAPVGRVAPPAEGDELVGAALRVTARLARPAREAAGAAVLRVVDGVDFAAVLVGAVAVGEARSAGGDPTDAGLAVRIGVGQHTRVATRRAVRAGGAQVGLAAVEVIFVAVAEVLVALVDGAPGLRAHRGGVRHLTDAAAHAAVVDVGGGGELAAVVALAVAVPEARHAVDGAAPGLTRGHHVGQRAGVGARAAVFLVGAQVHAGALAARLGRAGPVAGLRLGTRRQPEHRRQTDEETH